MVMFRDYLTDNTTIFPQLAQCHLNMFPFKTTVAQWVITGILNQDLGVQILSVETRRAANPTRGACQGRFPPCNTLGTVSCL